MDEIKNEMKIDLQSKEIRKNSVLNIILLIFVLGFAHLLDAYATDAGNYVASSIVKELLMDKLGMTEANAYGLFTLMGVIIIPVMFLQFLFKSAIDRFGRKKTLIIAILGMGLGNILKGIAPNFWVFTVGMVISSYFISVDVQVVYINEESPKKYRATIFSIAKVLGVLIVLVVPYLREKFVLEGNENWRPIFYVPAIAAASIALFAIFFLKESRAYEIAKLKPTSPEKNKLSFRTAVKHLRQSKAWSKLKWILYITIPSSLFTVGWMFAEPFMEQAGISELNKNVVIKWALIFQATVFGIQGFVVDLWGRRPAYITWAIIFLITLVGEIYCVNHHYLIPAGIFQGIKIGVYWNFNDVLVFMIIESVPTHLRGNAQGIRGLFFATSMIISLILFFGLNMLIGNFGTVMLIVGIPSVTVSIIMFGLKTVETKGIDLTTIEE
jgi:MFS family permease